MRQILFMLASLLLIVPGPFPAPVASQTGQTAAPETAQQKKEYEKSMEARLGDIGRQLDELRARANARTEEARKELNRYLKDAEKKQNEASRKLEEIRQTTNEKWKKFAADLNKAADDFEQAFERAKKRFQE